ncbi:hypothetical protein NPIL_49821 [Nephila pilipes]|uniref:Uncharacterized protein n=1 Tax=Nephila pilipes TaxID=299642 RepID=A0A8X6QBP7_NEPPI|nr:hypothetical protein NPIL_49821 [Nephila pilipes]
MRMFWPPNVPILIVDSAIEVKMSFIIKPLFHHIEDVHDAAYCIIGKLQSLFHRRLTQWMFHLDFVRKEFQLSLAIIFCKLSRLMPTSAAALLIDFRGFRANTSHVFFLPAFSSVETVAFRLILWLILSQTLPVCSNFSVNRVNVFRFDPECTLNSFANAFATVTGFCCFRTMFSR